MYQTLIFHKGNIITTKREDIYYTVINKDGKSYNVTLPNEIKINTCILSDDTYLYVRSDKGILIYKDNEVIGITQSCSGQDIETIFYLDGMHYFRVYNCLYRLVDFNWNDYQSLNSAQRCEIENWLDFRSQSTIHRDLALLFARELISI